MKNRLFTILLVTVLVVAVTSDHDDHRDDYHDHDDHHDDGRHHDDDDDDHHHGDGGGRRRFIIEGKIKFPGAPRDYRLTPHRACIHVFVRENILCGGEYCDIPEAAHEIIYGTDIHVDHNYEMSFRFKSKRFRSSQYTISAIFNVKRCRRRGVFIAGDYLSKTSNSFVVPSNLNRITVNPIVLEVGDSDNDCFLSSTVRTTTTITTTREKTWSTTARATSQTTRFQTITKTSPATTTTSTTTTTTLSTTTTTSPTTTTRLPTTTTTLPTTTSTTTTTTPTTTTPTTTMTTSLTTAVTKTTTSPTTTTTSTTTTSTATASTTTTSTTTTTTLPPTTTTLPTTTTTLPTTTTTLPTTTTTLPTTTTTPTTTMTTALKTTVTKTTTSPTTTTTSTTTTTTLPPTTTTLPRTTTTLPPTTTTLPPTTTTLPTTTTTLLPPTTTSTTTTTTLPTTTIKPNIPNTMYHTPNIWYGAYIFMHIILPSSNNRRRRSSDGYGTIDPCVMLNVHGSNRSANGEYHGLTHIKHITIKKSGLHAVNSHVIAFNFHLYPLTFDKYIFNVTFRSRLCSNQLHDDIYWGSIAKTWTEIKKQNYTLTTHLHHYGLVGTTLKPDITGEKTDQKSGTHDESKTGRQNKDKKKNFLIIGFGIFAFLLLVVILLVIKIKYQMCCNGKPVKPVSPKKKFSLTFDAFPVEKITTKENIYIDNPTDIPPFLPHSYEFPVEMEEDQPPPYRSRESSIRSRPPSYREINREAIYLDKVDYVMFNIPQKKDEN